MEIHCVIHQELTPDLLDKVSGLIETDETINTVKLCLTEANSRQLVSTKILARVYGLIIQRLAEERSICILFPFDTEKIKKDFQELNIENRKADGRISVEISSKNPSLLFRVLEVGAFTTFYAWISEISLTPVKPILLFQNLDKSHFVVVFSLYDESIEILSKFISTESITDIVREVGEEEKIKVFC